jgi:hypothetical protein
LLSVAIGITKNKIGIVIGYNFKYSIFGQNNSNNCIEKHLTEFMEG